MKRLLGATVLLGSVVGAAGILYAAQQAQAPSDPNYPGWAYAIPTPGGQGAQEDGGTMMRLPGTDRTFTLNKVRGRLDGDPMTRTSPADWFPGDHPTMPKIVEEGDNARNIIACSLCHYPNGKGRQENASPQGLAKEYLVQQMMDMRNGLRKSADPRKGNTNNMINFAKAMTPQEIDEAASYFASMKWTPWIKVVETAQVAKMRSAGGIWVPIRGAGAGMEPIGVRVVETPDNPEWTETYRNPRSGFTAYVPVGSVAKGEAIVRTGDNGKTIACTVCHGPDLNGIGTVPAIAARSPSYIARQLYDIKSGTRNGAMTQLMKPVVAKLTNEDFVNITAYLASLPAPAQTPTFSTAQN
jgi:cytochrome c553